MKKTIKIIVILFIVLSMIGCQKNEIYNPDETTNEDELNWIFNTLESNHYDVYANISKEEFTQEIEKVKKNVNEMSESDFYYSMLYLITLIEDAHTNIGYSDSKYLYEHGLPFAIAKFDDGWRVLILEEQFKECLGYQVVGINNIGIDEIYKRAKSIIPHSNDAWVDTNFSNTINFQEALEYLEIVKKDEPINLMLVNAENEPVAIPLMPLSADEMQNIKLARFARNEIPLTSNTGDIYRYLPINSTTLFIQYNSCEEDPNLSIKEFTKQVKNEIETNNYKTILFDLRYNSGGNSELIEPLFEMLKNFNNISFYTLIGRETFSSGIMNAVDTKEMLNSTLIGIPTGGSVNSFGELKFIETKKLPFIVYYSTRYFELIKGYEFDSLYPDIEISQNFHAYKSGTDVEVEWVLANSH